MHAEASGAPLAATNDISAGSVRKRCDAVRLGRKKALQRRARRTARHPLLAGVSPLWSYTATFSTNECGSGTCSPLSRRLSRCNSIASRISCIASSFVSPTATQPGRSGTYAPNEVAPCSRITRYSICLLALRESGLLPDASKCPDRYVHAKFTRHRNRTRLGRMPELPMAASRANKVPSVVLQLCDDLSHFHSRKYRRHIKLTDWVWLVFGVVRTAGEAEMQTSRCLAFGGPKN
jgi:hypothetical protein